MFSRGEGREGSVTLSTIHASKGQEYDNVVLDDDAIANLEVSEGFPGSRKRSTWPTSASPGRRRPCEKIRGQSKLGVRS